MGQKQRGESSTEQILRRAAEVCRAVHSYRAVITEVQDHFGGRTVETTERIQAGQDSYSRRLDDADGEHYEELILDGQAYWRSPDGDWYKPTVVASGAMKAVARGATEWQGEDASPGPLPNWIDGRLFSIVDATKVVRLEDEEGLSRVMMRFRETSDMEVPVPDPEEWHREFKGAFPRPEVAPPMPDQALRFLSPERIRMVDDLWIGEDDLLLYRLESFLEMYHEGELTARTRTTKLYSDFNAAELPAPLPES